MNLMFAAILAAAGSHDAILFLKKATRNLVASEDHPST
jgi:hypothetical protein